MERTEDSVRLGGRGPRNMCFQRLMHTMVRPEVPRLVLLWHPPPAYTPRPPSPTCPSCLLASTPGLEQLRNLRHLDVAYNLLEGHRELSPLWLLAELRKVSLGHVRTWEPALHPALPC